MTIIMAEVKVELGEFSTLDLIEELVGRKDADVKAALAALNPLACIRLLEKDGLSGPLLKALLEWAAQPVATEERLLAWKAGAGVAA
mgnify:FL=1